MKPIFKCCTDRISVMPQVPQQVPVEIVGSDRLMAVDGALGELGTGLVGEGIEVERGRRSSMSRFNQAGHLPSYA